MRAPTRGWEPSPTTSPTDAIRSARDCHDLSRTLRNCHAERGAGEASLSKDLVMSIMMRKALRTGMMD